MELTRIDQRRFREERVGKVKTDIGRKRAETQENIGETDLNEKTAGKEQTGIGREGKVH